MPWRVALIAPLVVLVAAGAFFVPWALKDRDVVVAAPQPSPRFVVAPLELGPGQQACARPVTVSAETDVLRLRGLRIADQPVAPLRVTVSGPAYRAGRTFSSYADFAALSVALPDPPRELDTTVCVENAGADKALVEGANEPRAEGVLDTTLDGQPSETDPAVLLLGSGHESVADRAGDVVDRAAAGNPAPPAVLWLLLALSLVGVPAGLALTLRRSDQA